MKYDKKIEEKKKRKEQEWRYKEILIKKPRFHKCIVLFPSVLESLVYHEGMCIFYYREWGAIAGI